MPEIETHELAILRRLASTNNMKAVRVYGVNLHREQKDSRGPGARGFRSRFVLKGSTEWRHR